MSQIITSADGVTRRSFLSTSGALAGAAALGSLAIQPTAQAQLSRELKVALIGCGGRGSGAANQALGVAGTRLVAVADAFPDRLKSSLDNLKEQKGAQVDVPLDRQFVGLDGYKAAIALADVVILSTPPGFRPLHFEEAVRQGKHIFMEKPVATDSDGVRRVLKAAEEAKKKNLKVGVGLQRHHQPGYLETIKRLHEGAIGDIHTLRVYWNDGGVWNYPREAVAKMLGHEPTELEYQMKNWYYFNWLCGDHINEQHIHNLDVGCWVKKGYPVKARGLGGRQVRTEKQYGEIFDHHAVEYQFADGSWMFSQCRHIRGAWSSVSEHAQGSKGKCDIGSHIIDVPGSDPWRFRSEKKVDPYQQEHDDLFAAIRNNTEHNEAFNGARCTLTSILGRMATYSGTEVTWDEALNSPVKLTPDDYERLSWNSKLKSLPDSEGRYAIPVPGNSEWRKRIV